MHPSQGATASRPWGMAYIEPSTPRQPLRPNPARSSLARGHPLSWCVTAADAAGIGSTGVTNGAIGMGVTAFQTKVVLTAATARDHTIRRRFGAAPLHPGVGVTHIERHRAEPSVADDPERACPSRKR
jgi:hypothetical protein